MITKPEDAMPRHMIYSEATDMAQVGGVTLRGGDGFTVAECAEIARAYAQANALWRNADTIPERRTLSVEVDAWLAKFKEWETI